MLVMKPN